MTTVVLIKKRLLNIKKKTFNAGVNVEVIWGETYTF